MAANGISGETLKATRQQKKLELAQAKRQGKTITEGSGSFSISGNIDINAATYKSPHSFDTTRLPTTYHSSSNTGALTNNSGTLKPGRPWIYTYIVTYQNVGGNKYFIDGVQQDTLNLSPGTYRFDYSAASGHPFHFSTTSDGTHAGGSLYNVGATYNASNKFSQIEITDSTPTLYYYCQLHNNMGGQINTP